ncbi:hypothetical protein NHQ30_002990 [Ciborinia camelliae]|nr:hypothetical protein NHQ30_002990 [Ciborinia camelliae]
MDNHDNNGHVEINASNGEASTGQPQILPIPERRNSQYEDPHGTGLGVGDTQPRRRSNVSGRLAFRDSIRAEDLESLTRTASAISGHQDAYLESHGEVLREGERDIQHTTISFPKAAKPGPITTIRELPSELNTPYATRPPSPSSVANTPGPHPRRNGHGTEAGTGASTPREYFELQMEESSRNLAEISYPDIGSVKSFRGALILLTTCGAQLMDNVFMTGVNISLPAIQKEFGAKASDLQWLISAYTLTFGGFLLLAGVLSDRFGRKLIFCIGMLWISLWTIANGFATSFIQLAIFRALQGIGAAMTVPSAVGIISSYFVAKDRTIALSFFAASGAVGFCAGLIFGGFLTGSLGWRYLFYVSAALTGSLGVLGQFILPKDRLEGQEKPSLDLLGAGLSTVLYYIVLIAQEVNRLSPGTTALYFLPMGATGFIFSMTVGKILERYDTKKVLLLGMLMMMTAPIPAALLTSTSTSFWTHVLPTSLLVVAAVTIVYCSCTIILLSSVPVSVKSLCGGMINTAFQIGSGVGLALSSAIVQAVDTNHGKGSIEQYSTGLWFCVAFGGVGFVASAFGVRNSTASGFGARRGGGGGVGMHFVRLGR